MIKRRTLGLTLFSLGMGVAMIGTALWLPPVWAIALAFMVGVVGLWLALA